MRLSQVIEGSGAHRVSGSGDPEIRAVVYDSRKVVPGALFVCLPGQVRDGHAFAPGAAAAGAAAIVGERPVDGGDAVVLVAPHARTALATCAANFHGRPGEALVLSGVTGTNGKTTVTYLYEDIARAAGTSVGVIGTVNYRYAGRTLPAPHTTPEAVELQALLAEMRDAGCTGAAMEVSSHALAQERVAGLRFRSAAFTNLTRDHLDFHRDLEDYFAAKRRLFRELLAPGATVTVNVDDAHGARLAEELRAAGTATVWRFSTRRDDVELRARDVTHGLAGIHFTLVSPAGTAAIRSPLVGAHNLENLLTAAGLALGAGLPLAAMAEGLSRSPGAPGRLERVDGAGISVFVDYAHTDDALRRACAALREVAPRRLLVVFGCGGDRDRGKRPLMGEVAGRGADLAVVTSDNPRTEDPASILEAIVPGVERAGKRRLSHDEALAGADGFAVEVDRRSAIRLAVAAAKPGDVILVAGKGHEDYQILGTEKIHFDDREEARAALLAKAGEA
jgi:UDP-N-acetylmuramoyl-L-alanyl-D-glutamate--2,6-diaminopimelate ligase